MIWIISDYQDNFYELFTLLTLLNNKHDSLSGMIHLIMTWKIVKECFKKFSQLRTNGTKLTGKHHVLWSLSYELSITILTYRLITVTLWAVTNQNNYLDGGENVWYVSTTTQPSYLALIKPSIRPIYLLMIIYNIL